MTEKTLIPPSPTEDDYVRRVAEAEAPPLLSETDPLALFGEWFREALAKEPNDGNAMALATVDEAGLPDVRMVLLKDVDARGFVFYSNLDSAKGRQLAANPRAALLFHWKSLRRQVRVRGPVAPVTAAEADAYFAERAYDARLGAIASDQSRPLPSRDLLEGRIEALQARYAGADPPRPEHWSGWRVGPEALEFWRDRPFRLHDRLLFERAGEGWRRTRLYP